MRLREHPGIGEGRTDILPCDPRQLSLMDGYNVRDFTTPEAREELDELKAKVKAHGVRTALVVKFDGENIFIVEGHKRHKVALELIAEHEASDGAEGRNIDFVPITAEKLGTNDIDRDYGLETSNSGSRLKPLELANLIYRLHTQRGQSLEAIAEGLGKSLVVIKNHLAMRAMPEPVKEQVREGAISATEAAKLVKNLPAGTDPVKAAELIKANQEENKRLGVGKRTKNKVTAKTLARDKPKPAPKSDPPQPEPQAQETAARPAPMFEDSTDAKARESGQTFSEGPEHADLASGLPATSENAPPTPPPVFSPLSDETPPKPEPMFRDADEAKREVHEQLQTAAAREFPAAAFHPPTRATDLDGMMFAIVKTLAAEAESFDLGELADDARVEVPASILKAADRFYREHIGDTSTAEAA